MPIFRIYTNTPKSEIPDGFLLQASHFIAKQLGKPESYVTVRIHPEQMMCHGGSTDPCASVELLSLGSLGPTNNEHAKAISDFIEKHLKIPRQRFFINFVDLDSSNIALGGKTFG
uniref:L-dopachrome isomerase n=1 Tax=Sinohyriopsis cumingii TaxID=165450 RepID=A0A386TX71_SINCU|nr:macrophage migration inhibitory factor [Sinohyriopsis cumingii]